MMQAVDTPNTSTVSDMSINMQKHKNLLEENRKLRK